MSGVTFEAFYEGCKRNNLHVGLDIETIPEQADGKQCFLPTSEVYDPNKRLERYPWAPLRHDPKAEMSGTLRTVTYLATVVDGETFCCSAKLGASLKSKHAERELQRMVAVLVKQNRVQLADFPIR